MKGPGAEAPGKSVGGTRLEDRALRARHDGQREASERQCRERM